MYVCVYVHACVCMCACVCWCVSGWVSGCIMRACVSRRVCIHMHDVFHLV